MVGSVPPSSMHSISFWVSEAPHGQLGDAKGGAHVEQGLAEGQGLAEREPLGVIGRVLPGRCQRLW